MEFLLALNIVDSPVLTVLKVLSCVGVVLLLLRRPRRWPLIVAVALAAGAAAAVLTLLVTEVWLNAFGTPLAWHTRAWAVAVFLGLFLAGASWWKSTAWRKVGAGFAAVLFLVTATVGINAYYGLNKTIASLAGISLEQPVKLNPVVPHAAAVNGPPLWKTWVPPAGMPALGTTGTAAIPGTESGFHPRPAGIYLPPAAQTANPPALPLVVMMMGQPGNPDPQYMAGVLNEYAAQHNGLAPIVIVADQLGDPTVDTLCLDTALYGHPETYINKDVVNWASTHLNIIHDRKYWTIAGYSHGGQCAISFAAKFPQLWGNVLDISGEEYPGAEHPADTLHDVFGGKQAAYNAEKPVNILGRHRYQDTAAIFTVSGDDYGFLGGAQRLSAAATKSGMKTSYIEIPNAGHLVRALNEGLQKGFEVLYPRLGLSPQPAAAGSGAAGSGPGAGGSGAAGAGAAGIRDGLHPGQ